MSIYSAFRGPSREIEEFTLVRLDSMEVSSLSKQNLTLPVLIQKALEGASFSAGSFFLSSFSWMEKIRPALASFSCQELENFKNDLSFLCEEGKRFQRQIEQQKVKSQDILSLLQENLNELELLIIEVGLKIDIKKDQTENALTSTKIQGFTPVVMGNQTACVIPKEFSLNRQDCSTFLRALEKTKSIFRYFTTEIQQSIVNTLEMLSASIVQEGREKRTSVSERIGTLWLECRDLQKKGEGSLIPLAISDWAAVANPFLSSLKEQWGTFSFIQTEEGLGIKDRAQSGTEFLPQVPEIQKTLIREIRALEEALPQNTNALSPWQKRVDLLTRTASLVVFILENIQETLIPLRKQRPEDFCLEEPLFFSTEVYEKLDPVYKPHYLFACGATIEELHMKMKGLLNDIQELEKSGVFSALLFAPFDVCMPKEGILQQEQQTLLQWIINQDRLLSSIRVFIDTHTETLTKEEIEQIKKSLEEILMQMTRVEQEYTTQLGREEEEKKAFFEANQKRQTTHLNVKKEIKEQSQIHPYDLPVLIEMLKERKKELEVELAEKEQELEDEKEGGFVLCSHSSSIGIRLASLEKERKALFSKNDLLKEIQDAMKD